LSSADLVIFHTPQFERDEHHTGVEDLLQLLDRHPARKVIITHINHHNRTHQELNQALAPRRSYS